MVRKVILAATFAALVGCGKSKTEDDEYAGGGSPSTSRTATAPSTRAVSPQAAPENKPKIVATGKPKKSEPEFVGVAVGEWSRVGDVQVKVTGADVRKVTLVSDGVRNDTEYETKDEFLLVWVTVQNLSKVKKLSYVGWRSGFGGSDNEARDEHGNAYTLYGGGVSDPWVKGGVRRMYKVVQPEDPPFSDIIRFEKPVKPATKIRLTLRAIESDQTEKHHFIIPASEWKK